MAGRKYGVYFNLRRRIVNYQSNAYGVEVNVPRLKLPNENVTDDDIRQLERQLKQIQTKIATAGRLKVKQAAKENAINNSLKSPVMGNKPDFHVVQNITADVKARQAEYERMRKSLNRSSNYYRNRYGVELERLPKLDKNVVPSRRQLQKIKDNIDTMKRSVRKGVREEEVLMINVQQMIQEAMGGNIWESYKANRMHELLMVPYQNNPKDVAKRIRSLKEKLDSIVERFLYIAYETTPDALNSGSATMTTEAWDKIEGILKQ